MQACQQARLLTVLILLSAARLAAAASAAALTLPAAAAQQAGQAQLAEVHQAGAAVEEGNVQHFHRLLRVGALLHAVCRQAGTRAGRQASEGGQEDSKLLSQLQDQQGWLLPLLPSATPALFPKIAPCRHPACPAHSPRAPWYT